MPVPGHPIHPLDHPAGPAPSGAARVYLDHNSTTLLDARVLDAMAPYLGERFGNPSSLHGFGQEARQAIDVARRQVAQAIGAAPQEVVFCSGGTEANNMALLGLFYGRMEQGLGGGRLVTSAVEHPSVYNTAAALERRHGVDVARLPVDSAGRVDPSEAAHALQQPTALVSLMLANNEVGTIQPVAEVALEARSRGALVHCDAVQGLGKMKVNLRSLPVDMMSISAHKIGGPKGCGALYIRRGVAPSLGVLIHGGAHEQRRRAGTENVAAIVGFGAACNLLQQGLQQEIERVGALRRRLGAGIRARWPLAVHNGGEPALPNTLNVTFPRVDAETLLITLDLRGVSVSTGAACSSGTLEPSRVLRAMGISPADAASTLRFSLGRDNTEADIDAALAALEGALSAGRTASR